MAEKGMSQRQVAKEIGIHEETLYRKMRLGSFDSEEMQKLVDLLQIEDPAAIFFAKKVT